jgi:hypothetical protein
MPHKIIDRGFDREYRFCCKVPGDVEPGARLDTEAGALLVFSVGRAFGDPPMRYAYVDISPEALGAPVDALTPEQTAFRERSKAYRLRRDNDALAAAAILAALERDGWSSRRNTSGSAKALKRVYAALVADGVLELDGYRYVPRRNT